MDSRVSVDYTGYPKPENAGKSRERRNLEAISVLIKIKWGGPGFQKFHMDLSFPIFHDFPSFRSRVATPASAVKTGSYLVNILVRTGLSDAQVS